MGDVERRTNKKQNFGQYLHFIENILTLIILNSFFRCMTNKPNA